MNLKTLTVNTTTALDLSGFANVLNGGAIVGSTASNTITGTVGKDTITDGAATDQLAVGDREKKEVT